MFTNNTPTAANTQHTFTFNALLELDSTQTISGATLTFNFGDGTTATATTSSTGIATVTHQCARRLLSAPATPHCWIGYKVGVGCAAVQTVVLVNASTVWTHHDGVRQAAINCHMRLGR